MKKYYAHAGLMILSIILFIIFILLIDSALYRTAVVRCGELYRQSREYPGFFYTMSEKKMCDEVGTEL